MTDHRTLIRMPALGAAIVAPVIGSRPITDGTLETPVASVKTSYTEKFDGSIRMVHIYDQRHCAAGKIIAR